MPDFKEALDNMQESQEDINRKFLQQMMWDAQCEDDEVGETVEAIMEWNKRMIREAVQHERDVFLDEQEVACQRCGTINEYDVSRSGDHIKATCQNCNTYIKFVKQNHGNDAPLKDDALMPYGKHKGIKLANIPDEYWRWMYDNDKLNMKLRQYVESNPEILK